jgi:hypothetical protein
VLSRSSHANLVRLLGWAQGPPGAGQMALVYELMERGSLHRALFGDEPLPLRALQRCVVYS